MNYLFPNPYIPFINNNPVYNSISTNLQATQNLLANQRSFVYNHQLLLEGTRQTALENSLPPPLISPTFYAKIHYSDGSFYKGETVGGFPHGKGEMRIKEDLIIGNFKHGNPLGEGIVIYEKSKIRFEGDVTLKPYGTGRGILLKNNSFRYVGETLADLPHGEGEMEYSNGNLLKGIYEKGILIGKGQCFYKKSGISVEGYFKNEKPFGECIATYPDGSIFNGVFQEDKATGTIVFSNGDRFIGDLLSDCSYGIYTSSLGESLKGYFKFCSGFHTPQYSLTGEVWTYL